MKISDKKIMKSVMKKMGQSLRKPYSSPTKEQIERWKNMPDVHGDMTEKETEEAFKQGFIV